MKSPEDKPSIGLTLCRGNQKSDAAYALRDLNQPIGMAEYRLTEAIPEHLRTGLPSIKELKAELRKGSND